MNPLQFIQMPKWLMISAKKELLASPDNSNSGQLYTLHVGNSHTDGLKIQ